MDLWTPEQEWEGEDAFLIGGGASLAHFDFKQLEGLNTIGCNDAFRLGGVVKFCFFSDKSWWERNKHDLMRFEGRVVTSCPSLLRYNVPKVMKMQREKHGIHSGSTLGWNASSGAASINLAISLGAIRIFLLGFDLSNTGTKSHWHTYSGKIIPETSHQRHLEGFRTVSKHLPSGVRVLNVTDGTSRLDCFEKLPMAQFQSMLGVVA